jgi:hypothetical protein
MRKRFWMQWAIAVVIGLVPAAKMLAISIAAAAVTEAQFPSNPTLTQYTVTNNSNVSFPANPIDIAVFVSTTTGSSPSTTNTGWYAVSLDAAMWVQSMGEPEPILNSTLPTWQQYTGLTYTQAFPSSPVKVNGYFLDYAYDGTDISFPGAPTFPGNPIFPSQPLDGFFFTGSPSSTFLVAGPADGTTTFAPGDVVTYSGTSTDTPEPTTLGLICLAAMGLMGRRREKVGRQ